MSTVSVTIGGTEYATGRSAASQRVLTDSLVITDIIDQTPNQCQIAAMGFVPTVGQEIIVTQGSTVIFGGYILTVEQSYVGAKTTNIQYHISAIDYTWALNKRKVLTKYTASSATTIAASLISTYCSGFTSTNVQASLPTVDEITFTFNDVTDALTQLAKRVGAYWYVDYSKDLHFFLTDASITNPTDLTVTHATLKDIVAVRDLSQVVTRAFVEGGGASVLADCAVGETIVPVENAAWFNTGGGAAVTGQQRLTYTGRSLGGGGGLVGPGAAPASAPTATLAAGSAGVDTGTHGYAVTFVTGGGESLPSPQASVATGNATAPASAPTAGAPTSGGSIDDGAHYYAVTFVTSSGETTPSTNSSTQTCGASSAVSHPVTNLNASPSTGGSTPTSNLNYGVSFVTADGETEMYYGGGNGYNGNGGNNAWDLSSIPTSGDGRVIARRVYRYIPLVNKWKILVTINDNTTTTYHDTTADGSLGAEISPDTPVFPLNGANTTSVNQRTIALSSIPTGGIGVTSRKVYRTAAGGSQLKLLATIADNATTTYSDTIADASLGANVPTSNTAAMNHVSLTAIQVGASGVTSRKVYRTTAGGSQLKLLTTIADNTTTTYSDSTTDASLGANVPTTDSSGLTQPSGQVVAGATTLIVAGTGGFQSGGGWAVIGNGQQVIRYTGVTSISLTGIPASGNGSITASVSYNSNVTAAPQITGVPSSSTGSVLFSILKGDQLNLLAQADDSGAQTTLAGLIGGDGIQEDYASDNRLSYTESHARAVAVLALRSAVEVSLRYQCRDTVTAAGATITVNLGSPTSIFGTFKIQQVTISNFHPNGAHAPTYDVQASTTRFSLEDLLRLARDAAA